jgi:P27 family predicted phage terminase small subunit
MPRGGKPKPTKLRILEGNRGKRPLPAGEPEPDPSMPSPPDFLGEYALEVWNLLAPKLSEAGILTAVDGLTLAVYCQACQRLREAERAIKTGGTTVASPNGYEIPSPHVSIAKQAMDTMRQYATELGLSPAARPKLSKGETKPDDPLETYLRKRDSQRKGQQ